MASQIVSGIQCTQLFIFTFLFYLLLLSGHLTKWSKQPPMKALQCVHRVWSRETANFLFSITNQATVLSKSTADLTAFRWLTALSHSGMNGLKVVMVAKLCTGLHRNSSVVLVPVSWGRWWERIPPQWKALEPLQVSYISKMAGSDFSFPLHKHQQHTLGEHVSMTSVFLYVFSQLCK